MAALRDSVSWLKHGDAASGHPAPGRLRWAYAYGRSQTGRLLRTLAYEDLNLDEDGREAIDGIIANVAGGMRGEFNQRFGQNSKDRKHDGAPLPVHRPTPERSGHRREGRAPCAARRAREPAPRLLHQYLGGVSPGRRLPHPHGPRRRARRRARPRRPRLSLRGHRARARHLAAHRHPARRRGCDGHGRALPAPARRGGLCAAPAGLPRAPRPLGGRGRRAAAEPTSPYRRRHRGPARGAGAGLQTHARGALPGAPCEAAAPRLDEHAAAAGPRVRLARLRCRRRRQRGGRHRPARARGAARHAYRLEPPASGRRRRRAVAGLRGRHAAVSPHPRRARGRGRPAPVHRGAVHLSRRLSRARARSGPRARPGRLPARRGRRAIRRGRRKALGSVCCPGG